MTTLYFALGPNDIQVKSILAYKDAFFKPSILISYYYLSAFKNKYGMSILDPFNKMLDSGAYSAYNAGKKIDINALIEESKNQYWNESVCLDDIKSGGEISLANSRYMKEQGSKAYPVFHIGEDYGILKSYCDEWDKVGLSCRFGESVTDSLLWLDNCYAKAWPHKFHSFGWVQEDVLMKYPFHSADASTWATRPARFGHWPGMGWIRVRGMQKKGLNLCGVIDHFLKMEQKLKYRWGNEWEKQNWKLNTLEKQPTNPQPNLI